MQFMPTTIKSRGYFGTTREDGMVTVKGRGPRRVMTMEQFASLLNPPPRRPKVEAPAK